MNTSQVPTAKEQAIIQWCLAQLESIDGQYKQVQPDEILRVLRVHGEDWTKLRTLFYCEQVQRYNLARELEISQNELCRLKKMLGQHQEAEELRFRQEVAKGNVKMGNDATLAGLLDPLYSSSEYRSGQKPMGWLT